ncbi:phage recombination protein Bet [Salmonella enterica subsp. enterica]|uniref:Phage recombination protein Bet n=1 Tax=Salmonella enterica I TaxID=59201 RepID=A0A7Z1SVG5_SALET|nr:phage recombination protein Bet [Salmonella enterica]ECO0900767.1 phage recombination protein Bet [Salmonella enterica subsp. enterica serovar Newport]ECC3463734.1 phage recombination protein Bet [Salmonella enterica subsp. enterica]ECO1009629.1 phage recombination protein Bet [Salmonella enterica subsp. enterica serovar Newport]EDQ2989999.1 phage recombination protein Bet [Salmonella enterica subsp. enterica]EGL1721314.1 phage recombination protein Bet [Salmonella enterica]
MSTQNTITSEILQQHGIDEATWSALKSSIYPGARDESVLMAVDYCRARQLDPLMKPVHLVPMLVKDAKTGKSEWRDVVMPGVGLYRIQADRSENYAGSGEPVFGDAIEGEFNGVRVRYPEWCKYSVFKKMPDGSVVEFVAREYWLENYATAGKDTSAPNAMWKKRPYAQLAKCCEAQALRKAWPETGQQPTAEEMEGKALDITDVTEMSSVDTTVRPPTNKTSLNNLISTRTQAQTDTDTKELSALLAGFTEKISDSQNIDEMDLLFSGGVWPDGKRRPGAVNTFSGEMLEKARDVYEMRRNEITDSDK